MTCVSFAVKNEFQGVANDNVVWATVGFSVLSMVFICVIIGLSCYNEFIEPEFTVFGSVGVYICSGIAREYNVVLCENDISLGKK